MFLVLARKKDLPTRINVQPKFVAPSDNSAPNRERPEGATHIRFRLLAVRSCWRLFGAVRGIGVSDSENEVNRVAIMLKSRLLVKRLPLTNC